MKILMLLEKDFPPDGRVENEIQELIKSGHTIDMVCYSRAKEYTEPYKNGTLYKFPLSKFMYKVSALALSVPFYFRYWYKNVSKVIRQNQYDAIHVHDLPLVKVGLKIGRKNGIKVIADLHENRPEIMRFYPYLKQFPAKYLINIKKWHSYQARICGQVDRLVLVTPEAKDYYIAKFGVKAERIFVVSNYANIEAFDKINTSSYIVNRVSQKFSITYFGDSGVRRGTIDLIHVAARLKHIEDLHFYIIGDSTEQKVLEEEAEKLHTGNVTLTGYIPFDIASSYLQASRIGVCPFHRNVHHDTTYANKMFQYMYYGLPLIVSDCPSQVNVVNESGCGIVFPAGNIEELEKAILEIYGNKQLGIEMGKKGKEAVNKKYNWTVAGEVLKDLYASI